MSETSQAPLPQRRRPGVAAPHRGQPDPRRRPRDREGDHGSAATGHAPAAAIAPARARDAAGSYFFAELECFVDLNPRQAGVHMSRFEEVVNEAIDEVVLGETLRAEELAAHIADRVREQQDGPSRRGDDRRPLSGDGRRPRPPACPPRRSTRCAAPRSSPSAAPAP